MTVPNVDRIREAKTKTIKDTGHHSYDGRTEYVQSLMDGGLCVSAEITPRGERTMDQWVKTPFTGAMKEQFLKLLECVKTKYPWHASAPHVKRTVLSYRAKLLRDLEQAKESAKAKNKAKAKPAKKELVIAK